MYHIVLAKGHKIQKIQKCGKPLVPSFPYNGSHTGLRIKFVQFRI
jgi:hypothetical protein